MSLCRFSIFNHIFMLLRPNILLCFIFSAKLCLEGEKKVLHWRFCIAVLIQQNFDIKPKDGNLPLTHLVSCSDVLFSSVNVDALSDVWTLLLQSHQHIARLIVKTCGLKLSNSGLIKLKIQVLYSAVFVCHFPYLFQSCHTQCVWWRPSPPSDSPHWPEKWSPRRAAPCRSYTRFLSNTMDTSD